MRASSGLRRAAIPFLWVIVAASATPPAPTAAQIPGVGDLVPGLPRVWVGLGLAGVMGGGVESGLGLLAEGVLQRRRHQLTLRALGLAEIAGIDDGLNGAVGELGLLYGRTRLGRWTHRSISTGLSWVRISECAADGDACDALGVPVVVEAAVQAFGTGLGLQLFGNLNLEEAYAGAALFVQLGWLP